MLQEVPVIGFFENSDCNSIDIKEQKKIKAKLHSLGKVSDILI